MKLKLITLVSHNTSTSQYHQGHAKGPSWPIGSYVYIFIMFSTCCRLTSMWNLKVQSKICIDRNLANVKWKTLTTCGKDNLTDSECCVISAAPVVTFNGKDYVQIQISPPLETHTNDISLRFKTHHENGLLFKTSTRNSQGYLKAYLEDGKGKLDTNIGQHRVSPCPSPFSTHLSEEYW